MSWGIVVEAVLMREHEHVRFGRSSGFEAIARCRFRCDVPFACSVLGSLLILNSRLVLTSEQTPDLCLHNLHHEQMKEESTVFTSVSLAPNRSSSLSLYRQCLIIR
jgi:hypothetical protein